MNEARENRRVVLCTADGVACGTSSLLAAHRGEGLLHRAFSVLVLSPDGGQLLLQQRASFKLLFARLWANSCCSHPTPEDGEQVVTAGRRRLREELGFEVELERAGSFVYQARDPAGHGSEHEHDTVLVGKASRQVVVKPDPAEVAAWRWITVDELQGDLEDRPELYVPWLPPALRLALLASRGLPGSSGSC